MNAREINFDGIVGPTHNYAGLSYGNVASMSHKSMVSSPKRAALEGLAKMKFLMDLGLKQAVLPPHERPHLPTLRKRGYTGTDAQILEKAAREDPKLLAAVCSASAMWAANAATVSPSADTRDGRVHFTPANLVSNLHRSIEAPTTTRILRAIFADEKHFTVHDPLPPELPDEGAANHMRLCRDHDAAGVEVFVYGRRGTALPRRFPARQTYDASAAIAKTHLLDPGSTALLQQSCAAIDAGAFHNDVVAVANECLMLYQKDAFVDLDPALPNPLCKEMIFVASEGISFGDAVASYLFNSQLVTLPDKSMSLIAPVECQAFPRVMEFIESIRGGQVASVHFIDVRQSMHNGGGPACLRLRVVLTDEQIHTIHGNVMLTGELHSQLRMWIEKHYRDELRPDDLRDPELLDESRVALNELNQILRLPPLYDFQQ
jgi:succinylarginine dihydrolase